MKHLTFALLILALTASLAPVPAMAKGGHCPPGLAKKSPACVPPGLARHSRGGWDEGDRFDDDDHPHWITDRSLYDLPRLPAGQRYVILGNRIYVVDAGTEQILSVMRAVEAILD